MNIKLNKKQNTLTFASQLHSPNHIHWLCSIHKIWFIKLWNELSFNKLLLRFSGVDYIRIFYQKEKNADICSAFAGHWDYFHNVLRNVWNSSLIQIALLNSKSRRNGQYLHLMSLALWVKWLHWKYSFSFLLNVSVCSAGAEIRIEKWLRGRICDEGKRPEKCQLRLLSLSVWLFSETLF